MNKTELYKVALSNVPRYSLLNEIFAIRDNRFPDEENDYTIKVYGSISIDVLNKYVRFIDRLVEYQSIDTINNLKELKREYQQLKEIEKEHQRINGELREEIKELQGRIDKAINYIIITYQIIGEQPSRNIKEDNYILSRLESFIETLKGDKE